MPSRELSYPVFDADNHFYEPREALTQFLPDIARASSTTSTCMAVPRSWSATPSATTSPTRRSRWSRSRERRRNTSATAAAARACAR